MIPRKQLTVAWVPTRQTVLSGSVDASGFPNALSVGSGLAVTLTATTTPCRLAFAAGFDAYGCVDYVGSFSSNQSFSSLTASTTCFLYVDRNSSTGALTTGFTTLAPVYALIAPTSPATDQHWFDLSTFTLKRWSGSAWVVFQRVFVGEAVTGASAITSVVTYAYRGFYQSAWVAVTASTVYNFAHNFGMALASANANLSVWASTASGSDVAAVLASPTFSVMAVYYGYLVQVPTGVIRNNFRLTTQNYVAVDASGTWQTSGYYKVAIARG